MLDEFEKKMFKFVRLPANGSEKNLDKSSHKPILWHGLLARRYATCVTSVHLLHYLGEYFFQRRPRLLHDLCAPSEGKKGRL